MRAFACRAFFGTNLKEQQFYWSVLLAKTNKTKQHVGVRTLLQRYTGKGTLVECEVGLGIFTTVISYFRLNESNINL